MFHGEMLPRRATADDADRIASLIRECYGSSHPVKSYVDPGALRAEIERGDAVYVLAEQDGRLVAQAALVRAGNAGLYECTRAVVSVDHRDHGYFGKLATHLIEQVAPSIGARFVLARAVTNHLFAQRFARSNGGVATGALLGMIPGTLEVAGFGSAASAISTIVHIHRIERAPRLRRATLAGADLDRTLETLARLGIPCQANGGEATAADLLGVTVEHDRHFGVAHLKFSTSAMQPLRTGQIQALARDARLIWADVPIEEPDAPRAIERLRAAGLGFAAYIPLAGSMGEDVLRLQLVVDPHVRDGLELQTLDENRWAVDAALGEARQAVLA